MDNQTTVMIADNTEEFCTGLANALQRTEGFRVVGTANDGEQAVRMIEEKQPQILVLDMMLAKRDGIGVLKAISAMERRPKVLATSGFMTEYVASAAANLGVQYLMLKPCDMTALTERLEELRGGQNQKLPQNRPSGKPNIEAMVTSIIHEIGVGYQIFGFLRGAEY